MIDAADRVVPHDLEAERAVLGAILVNGDRLHDVSEQLQPGDFFRHAHRLLYDTLRAMADRRQAIDLLTVKNALGAKELEDVGGAAYLSSLTDGVPRSAHVADYCQIVKDKAIRRRIQTAADQAIRDAGDEETEARAALERAEAAFYGLGQVEQRGELRSVDSAITQYWPTLERVVDSGKPDTGIPTGFVDLDRMTRGFFPGNLAILAARPAMGKSALALNIAYHVATVADETVAFFSLEMSIDEITERLLGAVGGIDMHLLMSGKPRPADFGRLVAARAEASAARLLIDDTSSQTVASIRGKCRRLKAKKGLGLVVVDYLQLLASERRYDNRVVEVGAMSRGLKQLAGELEAPILCLSQLNRASEDRSESRPRISDLRESGSLEQDANLVLLLHRPEEYKATPDNAGLAELIVGKNRKGPTGVINLRWAKELTRFDSYSDREGPRLVR
jgi:replicative DNA helicase